MTRSTTRLLDRLPWPFHPASNHETWLQGIARAGVTLLLLALLLAVGGVLVMVSGIVPIKASSGHWPITAWLLNFSMERSVASHTWDLEAPPLDDQRLVLLGAGHYETGCRPCHGSPGEAIPPVAAAMTPRPPRLSDAVENWEAEELFYIVKHGVKFTGMPAWPTQQRDDEVWAVTAFLQTLPETDADAYQQLVHGKDAVHDHGATDIEPSGASHQLVAQCIRCHGVEGQGRGRGAFPKLAGQSAAYLRDTLAAYRDNSRPSGVMAPLAAGLSDEAIAQIADHYAGHDAATSSAANLSSEVIAQGKELASNGLPDRNVPACIGCHGPSEKPRNPYYPRLNGQYADYLEQQLKLFRQGVRGGGEYEHLMRDVAANLTDQQIKALAAYYAAGR